MTSHRLRLYWIYMASERVRLLRYLHQVVAFGEGLAVLRPQGGVVDIMAVEPGQYRAGKVHSGLVAEREASAETRQRIE